MCFQLKGAQDPQKIKNAKIMIVICTQIGKKKNGIGKGYKIHYCLCISLKNEELNQMEQNVN